MSEDENSTKVPEENSAEVAAEVDLGLLEDQTLATSIEQLFNGEDGAENISVKRVVPLYGGSATALLPLLTDGGKFLKAYRAFVVRDGGHVMDSSKDGIQTSDLYANGAMVADAYDRAQVMLQTADQPQMVHPYAHEASGVSAPNWYLIGEGSTYAIIETDKPVPAIKLQEASGLLEASGDNELQLSRPVALTAPGVRLAIDNVITNKTKPSAQVTLKKRGTYGVGKSSAALAVAFDAGDTDFNKSLHLGPKTFSTVTVGAETFYLARGEGEEVFVLRGAANQALVGTVQEIATAITTAMRKAAIIGKDGSISLNRHEKPAPAASVDEAESEKSVEERAEAFIEEYLTNLESKHGVDLAVYAQKLAENQMTALGAGPSGNMFEDVKMRAFAQALRDAGSVASEALNDESGTSFTRLQDGVFTMEDEIVRILSLVQSYPEFSNDEIEEAMKCIADKLPQAVMARTS